jgi:hypothetical protein
VWPPNGTSGRWQSSPETLIREFAYRVLGWTDPRIRTHGVIALGPGDDPVASRAYEVTPHCLDNAVCLDTPPLFVLVADADGAWSVVSVSQPRLSIDVFPGDTLAAGYRLEFDLDLPANVAAHVGITAESDCWTAHAYEVGLESGPFELAVPVGDDPSCDDVGTGYVFAYATDDATVPVGDPFLEAAAIEYPWLTVIPIRLQAKDEGAATQADAPVVSCGGYAGTAAPEEGLIAQRDGVHVGVDTIVPIDGLEVDGVRYDAAGELVLPLAPGIHQVACVFAGVEPEPTNVMVFDRLNVYEDPTLHCLAPHVSRDATSVSGPRSWEYMLVWAADPANAPSVSSDVRTMFVGYPEGDVQRSIGYFSDPGAFLIARLDVVRNGEQEWTVTPVACPPK